MSSEIKESFSDRLGVFLVPFLTLIGDLVTIYAVIYVFITPIPWLWIFPILILAVPALYYFNKGSVTIVKEWFQKLKERKNKNRE